MQSCHLGLLSAGTERQGKLMDVRNCRMCGRIFNYVAGPYLCQICREKMEVKFQEVKEYIRENKGVGMREVSEACDVEMSQIQQWLREERLEVTEDSPIYITCEGCGANIRSGKYCDNCKNSMRSGFGDILNANKPQQPQKLSRDKDNPKMRFLN